MDLEFRNFLFGIYLLLEIYFLMLKHIDSARSVINIELKVINWNALLFKSYSFFQCFCNCLRFGVNMQLIINIPYMSTNSISA